MSLITEALFLWVLTHYIGMPVWAIVLCFVLMVIGRSGFLAFNLGGDRVLKL